MPTDDGVPLYHRDAVLAGLGLPTDEDIPFPLLTIHDAADRIGVPEWDIEDAIEEGRLAYYRLGPVQVRLRRDEVDRAFGR